MFIRSSHIFTIFLSLCHSPGLSSTTGPNFYDLAVFGGKAVRLVRLHVGLQDGDHPHLEVLGPLMELQDWALDVRWLSGDKPLTSLCGFSSQ